MIKDENAEKGQNRDGEKHAFFYGKIPRRGIFSSFPQRCLTVIDLIVSFFVQKLGGPSWSPAGKEGRFL